jgi:hypothetical protein
MTEQQMWLKELEILAQEYSKYKSERTQSNEVVQKKKIQVVKGAAKKMIKKDKLPELPELVEEETIELPVKVKAKKITK